MKSTADYQNNFQYENGVLQFIAQPEGYIYKDATGYRYVYQYKDHLGNNRLSFMRNAGTVAIVKETHYYPFGLTQKGYNNLTTSLGSAGAKKYQYNGKELQDNFGLDLYDYGARFYDVQLGRFHTLDPLAERYSFQSPFVYAANNPIRFIDFMGMSAGEPDEEEKPQQAKLAKAAKHAKNATEAGKKVLSESSVELSGSWLSVGGEVTTLGGKGSLEAGIANGTISADKEKVSADGKVLYAETGIELASDVGGVKTEIAAVEGKVDVGYNGSVEGDIDIGVFKPEIQYPGKNESIGFGIKVSALKVKVMANMKEMTTAITETLNFFDVLGAFDSIKPKTSPTIDELNQ